MGYLYGLTINGKYVKEKLAWVADLEIVLSTCVLLTLFIAGTTTSFVSTARFSHLILQS